MRVGVRARVRVRVRVRVAHRTYAAAHVSEAECGGREVGPAREPHVIALLSVHLAGVGVRVRVRVRVMLTLVSACINSYVHTTTRASR